MVASSKQKKPFWSIKRKIAAGLVLLIAIYTGYVIIWNVNEANKKAAAAAAEQARLAADPISTSGLYNALNKTRVSTGAPALATLDNLTKSAEQFCADMTAGKYFAYKNPTTGKGGNDFITDNMGDLYYKTYVSSIMSGNSTFETATDVLNMAIKNQSTTLNSPDYNSVGLATCASTSMPNIVYGVVMLANKQDKPVAPQVNNYNTAPRTRINCSSTTIYSTTYTNCY